MKNRTCGVHLRIVGLIALSWLFTSVTQAGAQQPITILPPTDGFKTLYRFCQGFTLANCGDTEFPNSPLTLDAAGNLWGTTIGDIFEIDSTSHETQLLFFSSNVPNMGFFPTGGGVVLDDAGTPYTTTFLGGNFSAPPCSPPNEGCGAVTINAGTSIYNFCSAPNCTDGAFPTGGLLRDASGNLYGTASRGGANVSANNGAGGGVVFKLDPTGAYSVLYDFCSAANCTDGIVSRGITSASLIQDAAGNLYGVTGAGGASGKFPYYQSSRYRAYPSESRRSA